MNPGEMITSSPDYASGGYTQERSPLKKNLPLIIAAGVVIFVLIIIAIALLSGGGIGGKDGKPSIKKEDYEAFKNYIYFGDEKNPDGKEISKSENMYVVTLIKGTSFLNYYTNYLESTMQQDFAAKIKELYEKLEIDTEKYPDYQEYSDAVKLLSIYIDPIEYYKSKINNLKTVYDEHEVVESIKNDLTINKEYSAWHTLAKNLETYHKSAVDLYAYYLKYGCTRDGQYIGECMRDKSADILKEFNQKQTNLQKSTSNAYSDSTIKMVINRLFNMIEELGECVR